MSKIGVTVLSIIQGKEMIKDSRDGIIVNAVSETKGKMYNVWYIECNSFIYQDDDFFLHHTKEQNMQFIFVLSL